MTVDDPERSRLLADITEFETKFRDAVITVHSQCGRVVVSCDHRGELLKITINDHFTRDVDIDKAEELLTNTINAAISAPESARDCFYDGLVVCGDTIGKWKKFPPPPRSREAIVLGFVALARARMSLHLENSERIGREQS